MSLWSLFHNFNSSTSLKHQPGFLSPWADNFLVITKQMAGRELRLWSLCHIGRMYLTSHFKIHFLQKQRQRWGGRPVYLKSCWRHLSSSRQVHLGEKIEEIISRAEDISSLEFSKLIMINSEILDVASLSAEFWAKF